VGPKGETLGVAIAPAGTPAIAVYENTIGGSSSSGFAIVVNLPVSSPPASPPTVSLPMLIEASAVAFNPVTADALIVGDDSLAIVKPPYTTVSSTILYPRAADGTPLLCGTTKHGIAANPDGVRALVVAEDAVCLPRTPPLLAPAPVSAPVVASVVTANHSDGDDGHHNKCEKRRKHHDDDRDRERRHDD
jgi:hypothetical protein